mmetsp:Transcript_56203/g.136189  ORF Transcript_56203/g.136189 Transcript_56203/m.136189 type:complete len:206 (+) Transcript_56203:1336-1953(+)
MKTSSRTHSGQAQTGSGSGPSSVQGIPVKGGETTVQFASSSMSQTPVGSGVGGNVGGGVGAGVGGGVGPGVGGGVGSGVGAGVGGGVGAGVGGGVGPGVGGGVGPGVGGGVGSGVGAGVGGGVGPGVGGGVGSGVGAGVGGGVGAGVGGGVGSGVKELTSSIMSIQNPWVSRRALSPSLLLATTATAPSNANNATVRNLSIIFLM